MGHTLVARFEDNIISALLPKDNTDCFNKIPFGRNCDRKAANDALPFHMTIMHWAKEQDPLFLPRIARIQPQPASIQVEDVHICAAACESLLLYLQISTGDGYSQLSDHIRSAVGLPATSFPHITLAADQNHQLIQTGYDYIRNTVRFPFSLDIKALELYHIWGPIYLVNSCPV